jgi:hypothetical protein
MCKEGFGPSRQPPGFTLAPWRLLNSTKIHRTHKSFVFALWFAAGAWATFANAQPVVALIQPASNQVFVAPANVTLHASASESNGTISQVEFFAGATSLGVVITNPYALTWSNAPAGIYALTAVATDNLGAAATSAVVSIVVDIPPAVAITNLAYATDFTLPTNIPVTAIASDVVGAVTNVAFFVDGSQIGQLTNQPYTFTWAGATPGIYDLTARATDNYGLSTLSSPVLVFVTTTGGALTGSVSAVTSASVVDLTAEGTNDWVHWGLFSQASLNRKAGVSPQINNFTNLRPDLSVVYQYADNANGYSWTDGTPTLAATNTTTGLYVVGLGAGFQITAPATTNLQTLRLYVGSYAARGQMLAYLSDFSAPIYLDTSLDNSGNGPGVVYTFNFAAASTGQALIVQYTAALMYNGFGNVTLQAATFSTGNSPPFTSITTPTNGASFNSPANLLISASASSSNLGGSVSKVEFFQAGTNKLAQVTNSPYSFTWSNVLGGTYTLTAKATDNQGATFTSAPVTVFVLTNGGFLHATLAAPASTVVLTTEGKSDWTHWGLATTGHGPSGFFNRKANVAVQLSDATNVGPDNSTTYDDNSNAYAWWDGTPTLSANTTTGIYMTNLNQGFLISAPADTTLRRLKVYVGVFAAQGKLEATLSDFSTLPFIDTSITSFNNASGVYTIIYSAASAGKKLNVQFTSATLFDELYGNVTLQSADLAGPAPALGILNPPPPNLFAFSFPTEQDWNYAVQFKDSLSWTNWVTLTNFIGNGANAAITDPPFSNRFYRVKMSF